jgi:hypothetical protein
MPLDVHATRHSVERYEAIRAEALDPHGRAYRGSHGIALVRHKGLAAWLDAWSRVASLPPRQAPRPSPATPHQDFGPPDVRQQITNLLASMAISATTTMEVTG